MAITLLVLLLGSFLTIGLVSKEYSWRTRATVISIAVFVPAWFYLFW